MLGSGLCRNRFRPERQARDAGVRGQCHDGRDRPDAQERWNYRLPAYQRIREAVQKMLLDRARPVA